MSITRALPDAIDLLALHRLSPRRYPLLLESVAGGNASSRWDLLFYSDGSGLRMDVDGITRTLDGTLQAGDFLDVLDRHWQQLRTSGEPLKLPFCGGWALLLSYELAGQIEPVLQLPVAPGPLPVALALRCPAAIAIDRNTGRCLAVCEAGQESAFAEIDNDLKRAATAPAMRAWVAPARVCEEDPGTFLAGVGRVYEYLRAGDVFQVNLSRLWTAQFEQAPEAAHLYSRLRQANPAPFAGLLAFEDWALVSSSPERLVSVRRGWAETRPIAGTRPRIPGDDDAARISELAAHPKERAEHVMLIDLERNDLGRVCKHGSVQVDEMMSVESYAHVHHIVSNVRGELRDGVTPGQVIAAVYPGGTITGCPKVRCMQIIAELEQSGRGAYTGALGYLNLDGDMDLNILIRSAWMSATTLQFRAGAGLVVDSIASAELDETRAKARGLLGALGST